MVSVNMVFWLLTLIGFPLFIVFVQKIRTYGKMLCFFLEEEGSITPKLLKVGDEKGAFVVDKKAGNRRYIVPDDPDCKRNIRFPSGWPRIFQETVPSAIWFRGNSNPLTWAEARKQAKKVGVSPVELDAVLDPVWMALIIRGAREGEGISDTGWRKSLPLLSVALGAICLLLLFYLMSRMNGIEEAIKIIR